VHHLAVVVEADPQRQPSAVLVSKAQQRGFEPAHRPHSVRQHQGLEAAAEAQADDVHDLPVHERLAAGQADLAHRQAILRDLVQIGRDLGRDK
jgi:hypothetical protein